MGKKKNLVGQRFGKLIVTGEAPSPDRHSRWKCLCDCGNITIVRTYSLTGEHTVSCGCARKGCQLVGISGHVYGNLTVICLDDTRDNRTYWICKCKCGKIISVESDHLKRGHTKSCGCILSGAMALYTDKRREYGCSEIHGHTVGGEKTREYSSWEHAKNRCLDPEHASYKYYGGRNITICIEWQNSFEEFLAYMGPCPPGMTVDRINNDGNYEPGNCRWATKWEQDRNRSNNVWLTYNGETLVLQDMAEKLGIPVSSMLHHLVKNRTIDEILAIRRQTSERRNRRRS